MLGNPHGLTLHGAIPLLAALRIAGVDNAIVEIQVSRIPSAISDFLFYLDMLDQVGLQAQPAPRQLLRLVDTIEVRDGIGFAAWLPADDFRASLRSIPNAIGASSDREYETVHSECIEPHYARGLSLRDLVALSDPMRAALVELIGRLALLGRPATGCPRAHGAGPRLYQSLLGAAISQHAFALTTVDAHRARMLGADPTVSTSAACFHIDAPDNIH